MVFAFGLGIWVFVYRKAPKWYNQLEPVAADVFAVVPLLLLIANGYPVPPFPEIPVGAQIDRVQVAGVSGDVPNILRFEVPAVAVTAIRVPLRRETGEPLNATVQSIAIPAITAALKDATGRDDLAQLQLSNIDVQDVRSQLNSQTMQVEDLKARVQLKGAVETQLVRRALQNIRYLRNVRTPFDRTEFAVDLKASGPNITPSLDDLPEAKHADAPVSVLAAASLQPDDCSAKFAAEVHAQIDPIRIATRIDGDTTQIFLRSLQSLPGSAVQIEGGKGRIALGKTTRAELAVDRIGTRAGASDVTLKSIRASANVNRDRQTITASTDGIGLHMADGAIVETGRAGLEFGRGGGSRSIPISMTARTENVRFSSNVGGEIAADLALIEASVSGTTTAEPIPQRFSGQSLVRVLEPSSQLVLVGIDSPLKLEADLWKGTFEIPDQPLMIRQAITDVMPRTIALEIGASATLFTLTPSIQATVDARAGLSQIVQDLGVSRAELNGLRLTAHSDINAGELTARMLYESGWNRVTLPPLPAAFCLSEVSSLHLSLNGTVSGLGPAPQGALTAALPSLQPCAPIPAAPSQLEFRISGMLPPGEGHLLRLQEKSGAGLQIKDVVAQVRNVKIPGGRLERFESSVQIPSIQNLKGLGGFGAKSDIRWTTASTLLDAGLFAVDGSLLAQSTVTATPDKLRVNATQTSPADRILAELRPFLADAEIDLGGIQPKGRLANLDINADLASGTVRSLDVSAALANGALASLDLPAGHLDIASADVDDRTSSVRLLMEAPNAAGDQSIAVDVDMPKLSLGGSGKGGESYSVNASMRSGIRGKLTKEIPEANRIAGNLEEVISGFRRHATNALGLVPADAPSAAAKSRLVFNTTVTGGSPVLRIGSDDLSVRISVDAPQVLWQTTGTDDLTASGSLGLMSDATLEGSRIVLDSLVSADATLSLPGGNVSKVRTSLPFQALLAKNLGQPETRPDQLWDDSYYARFWQQHRSKHENAPFNRLIDTAEMDFGGVAVRQLRFPIEPLRVAIGYGDSLQINVPFSAQALFGDMDGVLQSRIGWSSGAATADTRFRLNFRNVQTGALALSLSGSPVSVLEDQLDGSVAVKTDGLRIDSRIIGDALAGRIDQSTLETLGLSLAVKRSPMAVLPFGTMQATVDTRIDAINNILDRVLRNVKLEVPPRALAYRDLDFKLDVDHGRVQNEQGVMRLGGLQLFSSDSSEVTGEVRLHLGRNGERIKLQDLIGVLRQWMY